MNNRSPRKKAAPAGKLETPAPGSYAIIPVAGAMVNNEKGRLIKASERPDIYARELRRLFKAMIPKTWADYWAHQQIPPHEKLSAFVVCTWLTLNGCTSDQAANLCEEVFPELYADYWQDLPQEEVMDVA